MNDKFTSSLVMGEVLLTHKIKRLRPDGTSDFLVIEIDAPKEAKLGHIDCWTCNMRISGLPNVIDVTGFSSLGAINAASTLAAGIIRELPYAGDLTHGGLPNFGLPLCPITTTPEFLSAERERAEDHKRNFGPALMEAMKKRHSVDL
jgi:hypothetical protein